MTEERWEEIKGRIKDGFTILDERKEEFSDEPGTIETIEFDGPIGRMKLEYIVRPVVLSEKGFGSKRIGSDKSIQRQYSDSEFVRTLKAFTFNSGYDSWVEVEPGESFGG
ncbi:MAG: hypothetical protein Q8Q20_00955 [bacterium]|nr:hypothetical protein [bacterium]